MEVETACTIGHASQLSSRYLLVGLNQAHLKALAQAPLRMCVVNTSMHEACKRDVKQSQSRRKQEVQTHQRINSSHGFILEAFALYTRVNEPSTYKMHASENVPMLQKLTKFWDLSTEAQ